MTNPIKWPTQWRPPSGQGYVLASGSLPLETNLFLPIVDNTSNHYPIINTPSYVVPKYATKWTRQAAS